MIGIAAVFLALLLKKEKGELALLVGIAASVLIFGYTLSRISFILDFLRELMDTLPVDPALLKALLKMLGITYVADFSASVCREAGIWICRRTDGTVCKIIDRCFVHSGIVGFVAADRTDDPGG